MSQGNDLISIKITQRGITMRRIYLLLLFSALLFFQCCAINKRPSNSSREAPQQLILRCDYSGFNEATTEHITNEIIQPFMVRTIFGQITSSNPADEEEWLGESPLFEIRAIDKGKKIWRTHADKYGFFLIANVPEGQYCFKATLQGWNPTRGVIIVTKKADPKNKIVFTMWLGT